MISRKARLAASLNVHAPRKSYAGPITPFLRCGQRRSLLADYLNFTSANGGADTVIQVSTHGGGAAGVDQTIVLQGVDVTTLGADDSAIISSMLAANKLLVGA